MADKELWKVIEDFPNYKVSTHGRVKNILADTIKKNHNNPKKYVVAHLCNKGKHATIRIHRLVAEAFIPNPKKLPTVNHKDKNRANNNLDNLEWMTHSEQTAHKYKDIKVVHKTKRRPVMQYSLNNKFIKKFDGVTTAEKELGIHGISAVCRGKQETAGGYKFKFFDEEIEGEIWKEYKKGYKFQVSNMGRIKLNNGRITYGSGQGYKRITVYNYVLKKGKSLSVHILVAELFLKERKSKKKLSINHKDGVKSNNKVSNLEWATCSEQVIHAYRYNLIKKNTKAVEQYDKNGKFIKKFDSITEASIETNITITSISAACRGMRRTTGGYKWEYA
jgi:hypothetical protein